MTVYEQLAKQGWVDWGSGNWALERAGGKALLAVERLDGSPAEDRRWDLYEDQGDTEGEWRWGSSLGIIGNGVLLTIGGGLPSGRARALDDIATERRRQIEVEGWTPEHDDAHANGELADAASCYARGKQMCAVWPWADEWWKPTPDRRRQLVKAGALIVAEIERLDRGRP